MVLLACAHLTLEAAPRIADGSKDSRHAHQVMHDEREIIEAVSTMLQRRDLNHGIAVYPGLYPYTVAAVFVAVQEEPRRGPSSIEAVRWVSLATMLLALLVSFVLFGRVADNPWAGAVLSAFLGLHPEIVLWASRIHPDAHTLLFTHVSLALLALHVELSRPRLLWGATVFAGLSAATKLVGFFVMPVVAARLVASLRQEGRQLRPQLLKHALLFVAVFALLTPRILQDPAATLAGYVYQHEHHGAGGSALDWLTTLVSPRGLGWSGVLVAAWGLVWVARRRRADAALLLTGFSVFYFCFLLVTVRLPMPRYAFPSMWPALFIGAWALLDRGERHWRRLILPAAALLLFVAIDLPGQRAELRAYATEYSRAFSADKQAMGARLLSVPGLADKVVMSSPFVYVPAELTWRYVDTEDQLMARLDDDVGAVVFDEFLEVTDPVVAPIIDGRLGFVKTADLGRFVLYERRP